MRDRWLSPAGESVCVQAYYGRIAAMLIWNGFSSTEIAASKSELEHEGAPKEGFCPWYQRDRMMADRTNFCGGSQTLCDCNMLFLGLASVS